MYVLYNCVVLVKQHHEMSCQGNLCKRDAAPVWEIMCVLVCVPETKPIDGERVSNFWSCLSLSSGEIAHTLGPPREKNNTFKAWRRKRGTFNPRQRCTGQNCQVFRCLSMIHYSHIKKMLLVKCKCMAVYVIAKTQTMSLVWKFFSWSDEDTSRFVKPADLSFAAVLKTVQVICQCFISFKK